MPMNGLQWGLVVTSNAAITSFFAARNKTTSENWDDYVTWATANSKIIPDDTAFCTWLNTPDTDVVPADFIEFSLAVSEWMFYLYNESITAASA